MDLQKNTEFLLVIDEIQKINNWSEAVKREWDHDTWNNLNLKVVLLGSSRVMLEKGLSESLAGRFEEIRMTHWTYAEMRDAFGLTFEEYVYYGGYPGAATLLNDPGRWEQYIGSAIVDATLNKDILQNQVVMKPALLRQTFELGAAYSAQELSLSKLIGQLNDAGNTTTLTNYLQLLSQEQPHLVDMLNIGYCKWLQGKIVHAINHFKIILRQPDGEHFDFENEFMNVQNDLLKAHHISDTEIQMMIEALLS
jgi:predicted AAA+ superfamily ATPase